MDEKSELRQRCWAALESAKGARFPGTRGRIPNFKGAEDAAEILSQVPPWKAAHHIKANPDSPQRPVRYRALKEGKVLFMAVPKLAKEHPFIKLDPARIPSASLWTASSIVGADSFGEPVSIAQMPKMDVILTGCVGVTEEGARLGKGGGYSDLEYAMLREWNLVDDSTPIITTVHDTQRLESGTIPMMLHDISLDGFALPDRWVSCHRPFPRPSGVLWNILEDEKVDAIPVLRRARDAKK